jgi:hypothetical protein
MPWLDNTFVAPDRSIFNVLPNGDVEVSGPGWIRRRKNEPPWSAGGPDRCRLLKLGSVERARRIVEMVNEITNKTC